MSWLKIRTIVEILYGEIYGAVVATTIKEYLIPKVIVLIFVPVSQSVKS